jgi:hypothetical protein
VHTKDGVLYTLRFGEVAFGQGTSLSAVIRWRRASPARPARTAIMISASLDPRSRIRGHRRGEARGRSQRPLCQVVLRDLAQSFDSMHLKRKDLVKDKTEGELARQLTLDVVPRSSPAEH